MAAADPWKITIKGRQAHGSRPWDSIDPIMVAFQMGNNFQTIISRKLDLRGVSRSHLSWKYPRRC